MRPASLRNTAGPRSEQTAAVPATTADAAAPGNNCGHVHRPTPQPFRIPAAARRRPPCAPLGAGGRRQRPAAAGAGAWLDGRGRVLSICRRCVLRGFFHRPQHHCGRLARLRPDAVRHARRPLPVCRLSRRPGPAAGPLCARAARGSGRPQHGRQCRHALRRHATGAHPASGQPRRLWPGGDAGQRSPGALCAMAG